MHRLPGPETPQLKIHEPVYRFELGLQILEPRIVFAFELLDPMRGDFVQDERTERAIQRE